MNMNNNLHKIILESVESERKETNPYKCWHLPDHKPRMQTKQNKTKQNKW